MFNERDRIKSKTLLWMPIISSDIFIVKRYVTGNRVILIDKYEDYISVPKFLMCLFKLASPPKEILNYLLKSKWKQ